MRRTVTTLQRQLPTECQKALQPTSTYEWYRSKDGENLTEDEVQDAEAYIKECLQQMQFERMRDLQSSAQCNRAPRKTLRQRNSQPKG